MYGPAAKHLNSQMKGQGDYELDLRAFMLRKL